MADPSLLVLPEDPQDAQKLFHSLPVKNQLDIVLRARGKDRLHYLFLSEHPEQLVQQLSELEVFLTVKEVGENDSLDLVSLTTAEQFQYILDLDLWKRDQLEPEKVLHWMEILIESGDKKVTQFIHSTDPELIVLLLKKFLRVMTSEGEPVEVRERLPLFTLDQHYFIAFKGKAVREVFQPFLEIFYQVDEKGYRRLMDSLIVELESELEEIGYRLRNGRLADYGFPDFQEALEIYSFVNPDSLTGEKRNPQIRDLGETEKGSPTFYLAFRNESPLLSSVLSRMDPLEQDRLSQEITSLCNKAIVAEGLDLSNIAGMERVIRKVYHYLNLGLQYLSREEEEKAFEFVRSLPMQRLFQCGAGTTILLRRKAEFILKGLWFSGRQENLVLLDPPHFEKFEGILRKRPAFYRDGVYEDFKNLQDLKEAENFLEFVETVVNFFRKELNVSPRELVEMDFRDHHPEAWREMTLSTIFLTSLANQILKGSFRFEAIESDRLTDFLFQVFERGAQEEGVIKMEIKNGLRDWFYSNEQEEGKRQHLIAFEDFCLDLFEEQYGKIPPEERLDPRFVKGLLIKK
jgi:hypothetical protein